MTCKIKFLAIVGSGKNPPMLKSKIWNKMKIVNVEKTYLSGAHGILIIYR